MSVTVTVTVLESIAYAVLLCIGVSVVWYGCFKIFGSPQGFWGYRALARASRWPYWFKSGLLFVAITSFVLLGGGYLLAKLTGRGLSIPNWLLFLPGIGANTIEPLFCQPIKGSSWAGLHCLPVGLALSGILIFPQSFVFGGIIGWLYGALRKRKGVSSLTG
jgi:hypothetical protein